MLNPQLSSYVSRAASTTTAESLKTAGLNVTAFKGQDNLGGINHLDWSESAQGYTYAGLKWDNKSELKLYTVSCTSPTALSVSPYAGAFSSQQEGVLDLTQIYDTSDNISHEGKFPLDADFVVGCASLTNSENVNVQLSHLAAQIHLSYQNLSDFGCDVRAELKNIVKTAKFTYAEPVTQTLSNGSTVLSFPESCYTTDFSDLTWKNNNLGSAESDGPLAHFLVKNVIPITVPEGTVGYSEGTEIVWTITPVGQSPITKVTKITELKSGVRYNYTLNINGTLAEKQITVSQSTVNDFVDVDTSDGITISDPDAAKTTFTISQELLDNSAYSAVEVADIVGLKSSYTQGDDVEISITPKEGYKFVRLYKDSDHKKEVNLTVWSEAAMNDLGIDSYTFKNSNGTYTLKFKMPATSLNFTLVCKPAQNS